jgi:large subunit ribosomal protein L6
LGQARKDFNEKPEFAMSRIGKRPIPLPKGVTAQLLDRLVVLKGPKGESRFRVPEPVRADLNAERIQLVADYKNDRDASRLMGTSQSVLTNMVKGVSEGFVRKLILVGVGYRASVQGPNMELTLGFSKPVRFPLPAGVTALVENNTAITLASHDKVVLGQTAATIRSLRPPEPYQGKGVMYEGEKIKRKAGKTGKK